MADLLPIDTNVTIPVAVRRAASAADEIHRQLYVADAAGSDAAGDKAGATDAGQSNQPAAQPTAPAQTAPAAPAAPVASGEPKLTPTPDQPVTPPGNDGIDWRRRYEAMKGRYDAEVPRFRQQVADLSRQKIDLEHRISEIEAASAKPEQAQRVRLLSDQEVGEYGEEFLNVVGRRAKEEVTPEVEALKQEVANLKLRLANVSAPVEQITRDTMFSTLDSRVPNWRDVNTDANFISWLSLPDPFSGVIRQSMLNEAFERNDAPRVAAFFSGFLAQEAAVRPAANPDPDPKVNTSHKVPLEVFAAPGRAKSAAATTAPAEKPFITRSEITAFYDDVRRGVYTDRPDDKDRIERAISEASREGRVR